MAKSKDQKVYMPLMHGDWLKGTQGMKAEVRGVYITLLLYQWNKGFIPSDWEELCLIDPEVGKVWDKLKEKFLQVAPGKLQNENLEDIRAFWAKQKNNGEKGGRPKKEKPEDNPTTNPNNNPNTNLHYDLDLEVVIEEKLKESLDEIYLDQQRIKWPHLDFAFEYQTFCEKVRGSPGHYRNHDNGGIRLAFQKQLRDSKNKKNVFTKNKPGDNISSLVEGFKRRNGGASSG